MYRSDARVRQTDDSLDYTNCLDVNVLLMIEKELLDSPYDMISLVFLLYDIPDTALQQLYVYQQVSQNTGYKNIKSMNLLHEWWQYVKSRPTWKHEFIEALLICQLYGITRKLGLDEITIKKHYQPDNIGTCMYINPLKKALYKLCENMTSGNLLKLKQALTTYDIDTTDYESCELVFLKLMCKKFITMRQYVYDHKVFRYEFEADKLLDIVECLPGLQQLSVELKQLQSCLSPINNEPIDIKGIASTTTDETKPNKNTNCNEFDDILQMIDNLPIENITHFKTDTKKLDSEVYKIMDPKKIGVCIIINQEKFYPSKESIGTGDVLTDRKGSSWDEKRLNKTMASLNFEVYSKPNLNHKEMFTHIKSVVQKHVNPESTSIIMVCILSHGVRGHVYAADSVKVKVADIQSYLDSDELKQARGIPKVFIIQACQVEDMPHPTFVADGPTTQFYLPKSDFLVYWATVPEYEAYRNEDKGSIFIYCLCQTIIKYSKTEPVSDIFTRVNKTVSNLCTKLKLAQVPIFETTLQKKLYFQVTQ